MIDCYCCHSGCSVISMVIVHHQYEFSLLLYARIIIYDEILSFATKLAGVSMYV